MATITSNSPEETTRIGERFGSEAEAGWLIGLSGDLGAGKTQLVKGIARGLGIQGRISSPTFGLMHELEGGRLPVFHIDLYRLKGWDETQGAGLDEYLFGGVGVVVVEWIERLLDNDMVARALDRREGVFRRVTIEIGPVDRRQITYEDSGH